MFRHLAGHLISLTLMCAWPLLAPRTAMAQERQKLVLTVHASGQYSAGAQTSDAIVQKVLNDTLGSVDYYSEYLDLARFPDANHESSVRTFLLSKYAGRRFDLLIATSDSALAFLARSRDALFPGVPIVFATGADPVVVPNSTGVVGRLNLRASLEMALRLRPETTRVVVVSGASEWDGFYEKLAREQFKPLERRLSVTSLSGLPLPGLLRRVRALPPRSIVFFLTMVEDGAHQRYLRADVVRQLSEAGNAPLFDWFDDGQIQGSVGGPMLSTEVLMKQAATVAARVLAGERPESIPVADVDWTVTAFDWRQLRRWGIDEKRLPANSTILYRQPDAWEQYERYVIGGGVLLLMQSGLIAALLFNRGRRMRVERDLRESEERFRLLADTAPVLVWRSGPDRGCDYFNRPWLEFTGRTIDEELGDGWAQGVWPEDLERCLHTYKSAFDSREPFSMEYRLRGADGAYRWVLDTGVPRFRPDAAFAGYIGTAIDISERRTMEDELRHSEATLQARNREIHDLSARLIKAQDAERARIARDLHDDISQQLAGLSIALTLLEGRLRSAPVDTGIRGDLSLLQQRTAMLTASIRHLSRDLHPQVLRHGLVEALDAHCAEIRRRHVIRLTFGVQGDADSLPGETALCLYRVAQETLRNVVSHSGALQANIRLVCADDHVEMTITDDGQGFDVAQARSAGTGLGLVNVNERVRLAGGTVSIVAPSKKGTHVTVWIPRQPRAVRPEADDFWHGERRA